MSHRKVGIALISLGTAALLLSFFLWSDPTATAKLSAFGALIVLNAGFALLPHAQPLAVRSRWAVGYLLVGLLLLGLTGILKITRLPGANMSMILATFFLSFAYLPLLVRNRFEKWKEFSEKTWVLFFLCLGDLISLISLMLGFMFRILDWRGYTALLVCGAVVLPLTVLAWNHVFKQVVKKRKEAEDRAKAAYSEITDSIKYAKRIQQAMLPEMRAVEAVLPDCFVLFRPKDIVSGDFYWMTRQGPLTLFAAADCTGHGVPGALVSVVCNNSLNRAVREYGLTDPGRILDKTREIVTQELAKSDDAVKDGMDTSLCVLEGNTLLWAGANNPLWILRGDTILETKADKQPIGKYADPRPFTSHCITLEPGDVIYCFTDGYQDQFGGAHLAGGRSESKKYKAGAFKAFLLSIRHLGMAEQRAALEQNFDAWRGPLEQVDDVCIVGVRV